MFFKALAENNPHLTQQLQQIRAVVKGSSVIRNGSRSSSPRREKAEKAGAATKPVSAIRQFCLKCVGGGGRKAASKLVRECPEMSAGQGTQILT